jgi:NADH dehydrogenase [ubiquinone] 1 alpha subcomplex assembly factor 1
MFPLFLIATMLFGNTPVLLFDFSKNVSLKDWNIVDDRVMGGVSNGTFTLDENGHGKFSGYVSLDNNGGFSSVRYQFDKKTVSKESKVILRVKGDKKDYQFRIKDNANQYYSYITTFSTNGEWQDVEINLKDLYPSFRGRKLNMPNFNGTSMEEIVFLIANGKDEKFELLIDKMELY